MHEVFNYWRVALFIFAGNKHRSDAQQLILTTGHKSVLQEAVNDVDSDVEGLRQQLEFEMDLNKPPVKNTSHLFSDLVLKIRDVVTRHEMGFCR